MRHGLTMAIGLALALVHGGGARAAEPDAPEATATPEPAATAADLLAGADAAIDAGNLPLARQLFERVAREHPDAPEAGEARRALKILAARAASSAATVAPPADATPASPAAPPGDVIVRGEPYSKKTLERLRLSAWEKLDFGVSAFLYGSSVGVSYALSLPSSQASAAFPAIAIGALAYTMGAVAFLTMANPDRGDLPLALSITSYLPTTTLLVTNLAIKNPDSKKTALATAATGLLSIPIAVVAARQLDLDPGDTQLVRDAGFWGLVLAVTAMEGWGGSVQSFNEGGGFTFTQYTSPSSRALASAGLLGLYGGLGLGLLGAHTSDVSLERVRVTTWGGYGGAVLGLLLGAAAASGSSSANQSRDIYRGISIGAALGLLVTFASTSGLDGIPPEDPAPAHTHAAGPRLAPTVVDVAGGDGRSHPGLGLAGMLF
jgi:hypothetical protein